MKMSVVRLRTPLDYVHRKWERTFLSFETRLSTLSSFMMPVRVINFSQGGFLISCDTPLNPGDDVLIELVGIGEVSGRITWCHRGQAGGVFNDHIRADALIDAIEGMQNAVAADEVSA
jgi:hypothetical protein